MVYVSVCAYICIHKTLKHSHKHTNKSHHKKWTKIKWNKTIHIFIYLFFWQKGKHTHSVYPIHLPKSVYALSSTVERIIKINKPSHSCLILNYWAVSWEFIQNEFDINKAEAKRKKSNFGLKKRFCDGVWRSMMVVVVPLELLGHFVALVATHTEIQFNSEKRKCI